MLLSNSQGDRRASACELDGEPDDGLTRTRTQKPPKPWRVFGALALVVVGLLWLWKHPLFVQAALGAAPAVGAYVAPAASSAERQRPTQQRPKHMHPLAEAPRPATSSSAAPPPPRALVLASAAPLQRSAAAPSPRSAVCVCSNAESGRGHVDQLPAEVLDPSATQQCYAPDAGMRVKCDNPIARSVFCNLSGQTDKCFFTFAWEGLGAFNPMGRRWDEDKVRRCLSPDRGGGGGGVAGSPAPVRRRALFLLGDSTSDSIRMGVEQVAAHAGMSLVHLAVGCCPWGPANYTLPDVCTCHMEPRADTIISLTTEMLTKEVRRGDVVMLVSRFDVIGREAHLQWYERVALPLITARGASLVLVRIWNGMNGVCNRNPDLPMCWARPPDPTPESLGMEAFAAAHRGVHVLDLSRILCSERGCGNRVPGSSDVALFDAPHLSMYGSLYTAPFVCAALAKWGLV